MKRKIILMFVLTIISFSFVLINVFAESNGTKIQIDYPAIIEKKAENMLLYGWVMSETKDRTIEVYVDNEKVDNVSSEEREDVLEAIKGYGGRDTNEVPGFKATFDSRKLSTGTHKATVKVIDNYTGEVLSEQSKKFEIEDYETMIQIDYPTIIEKKAENMLLYGWVMSEAKDRTIEVYVDNEKVDNVSSEEREDVLEAIKGYGGRDTNEVPGFKATFDSRKLSTGTHKATVKVIDNYTGEVLSEQSKNFEIEDYETMIQIDYPTIIEKKAENMLLYGWVMSEAKDRTIEVYVDNEKVDNVSSEEREDVLEAIKGYGGRDTNEVPGFKATFDSRKLSTGTHKATVKVIDNYTGEVLSEQSKNFEIEDYETIIQIDYPTIIEKKAENMLLYGWVMSEAKDRTIEVYVDNEKVDNVSSEEREDVLEAIKGYGGRDTNEVPGFKATFDSRKLSAGTHKATVKVIDNYTGEVLSEQSKNFEIEQYASKIQIDDPINYISGDNFNIRGWVMTETKDRTIEVYVDNEKVDNVSSEEREDVLEAIKGYGGRDTNEVPGFKATFDSTSLKDGSHNVKVIIRDLYTNEIIDTAIKSFILKKYNGRIIIDVPQNSNFKDLIFVSGWALTEVDGSYIKMYIDGKEVSSTINRVARQDVLDAVKEFGDSSVNPLPGFETTIDIASLNDGKHTLSVQVFTKYNDMVDCKEKQFYKYSNVSTGIDVSKYQGNINWHSVKNDGISFAFVRAGNRGYGTGLIVEDPYFKNNVINASNAGVKVGLYFYSQAINETEAIEEASFVTTKLLHYGLQTRISLPIVIDVEYATSQHNGRADNLTKQERTDVVRAFANHIKSLGYEPMIYASKSFLYNNLAMNQLSDLNVWLAHYTTTENPMMNMSDYTGTYQVWQYTSSGYVNGINGNVDMNISFANY